MPAVVVAVAEQPPDATPTPTSRKEQPAEVLAWAINGMVHIGVGDMAAWLC